MKIGFTGTQLGMTNQQLIRLGEIFKDLSAQHKMVIPEDIPEMIEFHHGDCIGADLQAHYLFLAIVEGRLGSRASVIVHPPSDENRRAFVKGARETNPRKPFLVRNKAIVNDTELLIATPKAQTEELRSGTWSTIRHARNLKRPIIIVFPDGMERRERWKKHEWSW